MNINSCHILLKNVLFFAHHGVAPQEMVTGNEFYIDLSYADIYAILKQEMEIPSKLLEHVCGRIATRLFQEFPGIEEIEIKLSKRNPPMGADIDSAGVEMHCTRS